MRGSTIALGIRDEEHLREVLGRLRSGFACRERPDEPQALTYYDTFDHRLGRAGLRLCVPAEPGAEGFASAWHDADGVADRVRVAEPPRFVAELPEGRVRDMLARAAAARRLLPQVEVERRVSALDVLDAEDKTVVRVEGRRRAVREGGRSRALPCLLVVSGVKGYDAELLAVVRFLELRLGLRRLDPASGVELEEALRLLGRDPLGEGVFRPLELEPREPGQRAVARVLAALLDTMHANEEGMRLDLDTEFLHEYRIALRRTRATLSLFPGVFPAAAVEHYQDELRRLGAVTGPLRDLDVLAQALPRYEERLAEASRSELEPLRAHLARLRSEGRERLLAALADARHERFLANWGEFLAGEPANGTHLRDAPRPVAELVAEALAARLRRLLRRGRGLHARSPDERFHALRIEAKRLRYLLELFRSLLPERRARRCLRALKRLQRHLGDFNDLSVQLAMVEGFAREEPPADPEHAACLLAVGRLAAQLERAREEQRARFLDDFPAFAAKRNRKRFRKLKKALREAARA